MSSLLIIRGAPGSGKTTYAITMCSKHELFEADQFRIDKTTGEYVFNPKDNQRVHSSCLEAVKKALKEGKDVCVANTFTKLWEIAPYLKLEADKISVIRIMGNYKNNHNVPEDVVERMKNQYEPYDVEIIVKP